MVANGCDAHYAVAFHYFGASHHLVGRKCGIRIELSRISGLVTHRFACKRGFVDVQHHGFEQFAVGRNFFACVDYHYVTDNYVALGNFCDISVAYHLYGFVIIDLIEQFELLVCFLLEIKSQSGSQ